MEITQEELERLCKEIDMLNIEHLGNGLYRLPIGIICGESFLNELDKEIRNSLNNAHNND